MKKLLKAGLLTISTLFVLAGFTAAQSPCDPKDNPCKIDAYSKRIAANSGDGEAFYGRGTAYEELKQYDRAIADYTKYIATNPTSKQYLADGYFGRGNCYKYMSSFVKALADYNMALQLFPTPNVYINRGNYFVTQKEYPKALADYNQALALNKNEAEAYYNRAKVYSAQKLYAKAIADLDLYLGLNASNIPFLADGYQNRAIAYSDLGKLTQALADINSAIGLDATTASRFIARANIYRKMGKTSLAAADDAMAESLKK